MIVTQAYVGCPVWAHAPWAGGLFTATAGRGDYLKQYSSVFLAVEGGSTFYGLPSVDTVQQWSDAAPPEFRFCFKFPRTITHDLGLIKADRETDEFLTRLAPLNGRLGPIFLQLHESFGIDRLGVLYDYLNTLPKEFLYAVEVRHRDFFDSGAKEKAFDDLLTARGVDRVNFDTRGLYSSTATDEATLDAKRRKPRLPVRATATGKRPFVRFVGDPDVNKNDIGLANWADQIVRWVGQGKTPYFFTHHPDEAHAPELARRLQRLVHERMAGAMPPPAPWPGEIATPPWTQMTLFGET